MKLAWLLAAILAPVLCWAQSDWKSVVSERLPLYGHRNWIVIADSAYPAQSRDGIETVVSNADQMQVLSYVLHAIETSKHVRANVFLDRELDFVPEAAAPGVEAYRNQIKSMFGDSPVETVLHQQIISRLDNAGQTFRVLIIKTNLAIPYTSVFLQLDCKYWSPEDEQKMRKDMAGRKK